tara:strand:+ start:1073 stop:1525 length:453 start_codon:yes stop_codon:yes gene_type:complete
MASTLIQSDKSISDNLSKSKVVARKKGHRDLDLKLGIHPIRKDLNVLKDDNAIKNAIKNLLVTNANERPFQPFLGANLRSLLFEPADALTKIALRENILEVIKNHEPRVEVQDIDIKDLADQNAYRILLKMRIKEFDNDDTVEIVLRRLR